MADKIIDIESLRRKLIDYFGSAAAYEPMAMADAAEAESASDDELIAMAKENGIDIERYYR